jgi:glutaredoxin
MKRVVLYTTDQCSHCQTAKRYLEQQGIAFRTCNIKTAKGQKEFSALGFRAVPVLKVGDQLLNGFSVKGFNGLFND